MQHMFSCNGARLNMKSINPFLEYSLRLFTLNSQCLQCLKCPWMRLRVQCTQSAYIKWIYMRIDSKYAWFAFYLCDSKCTQTFVLFWSLKVPCHNFFKRKLYKFWLKFSVHCFTLNFYTFFFFNISIRWLCIFHSRSIDHVRRSMRDLSAYNLGSSSEIDNGYAYQKMTPVSNELWSKYNSVLLLMSSILEFVELTFGIDETPFWLRTKITPADSKR